ncbi:cell division protein FtsZ [Gangjinia marincola]|uniref:Cell division protein FtsZ n=1 Tax=Gangjinia marincola TaxID=578463 RepID=A0ABP3XZJ7_9FLAO
MSSGEIDNIAFDLPKNKSNVIKVIGVGGGGSNAINYMFQQGINGVDFVVCNTDAQALQNSPVPNKIQLGVALTEGLGAGANPQVGEESAIESFEEIKNMLSINTKMVFITAGMGGGTGTGAAPIIAKLSKELDILTVGIVTVPFQFEGKMRNEQAQLGVEKLRQNVDSLIVINNNKLREVYGNLGFKAGFSKADEVLATASKGIAEVITHHYTQNIDLRDAKTVLSNSGTAIMGSATASGSNRAVEAITKALDSPLLNDNKISGAKNVLLLIVSGSEEITLDEIGEVNDHIQAEAGHSANIIMGVGEDAELEGSISVTVIATGFDAEAQNMMVNTDPKKIIHTLEDEQRAEHDLTPQATTTPAHQPLQVEEKIVHVLEEDPEPIEEKMMDVEKVEMDLVPTSLLLKNMDVVYEEVLAKAEEEFTITERTDIISNIEVHEAEEVTASQAEIEEQQAAFSFDFPVEIEQSNTVVQQETKEYSSAQPEVQEEEERVVFTLEDDTREIEVKDAMEVKPTIKNHSERIVRYSLEEDMPSKPSVVNEEDATLNMQTKTLPMETEVEEDQQDPFNQPLSEELVRRAAERRAKMKEFNYKFRNANAQIDDIEKQPAYKRAGVDLENTQSSEDGNLSRITLNTDENGEDFRSNNSFLHDNVD